MNSRNTTLAFIFTLALTATASIRAEEMTPEPTSPTTDSTVTITGRADTLSCDGLTQDEARRLAEDAQRAGAHRKAAACFRIAGDPARANRAQMHASADDGAASAQRIKANMELSKAQAKRLRDAFRHF
jgi:hypothetical protein